MDMNDIRMIRHLERQDSEKSSGGTFQGDASLLGPPHWDRASWEAYKAQFGFYPYGWQNGTRVMPPSFEGAPPWALQAMGLNPRMPIFQ